MPAENGRRQSAELGVQVADLSALLSEGSEVGLDLDRVVGLAAKSTPNADECGLTLLRAGRRPTTLSATGEICRRVDELQYSTVEGPCLEASDSDSVRISDDLEVDERWPRFGPQCVQVTGVRSMMSVRLLLADEDRAAINFYARRRQAFGELDFGVASLFAPFAALAVEQALRKQDTAHFTAALSTSRQIGTAVGIIMARRLVTADEAFALLAAASQHTNRKLRDIAAEVELTGDLPAGTSPEI